MFFMQSPSFLDYQRTMQETQGKNNAQTLFGVHQILTDNHIRSLLDAVEPSAAYPMFPVVFNGLRQAGVLDSYRAVNTTTVARFGRNSLLFIAETELRVLLDPASR